MKLMHAHEIVQVFAKSAQTIMNDVDWDSQRETLGIVKNISLRYSRDGYGDWYDSLPALILLCLITTVMQEESIII